jgi:hypothetical protein
MAKVVYIRKSFKTMTEISMHLFPYITAIISFSHFKFWWIRSLRAMVTDRKFVLSLREGRSCKTAGELRILTLIKLHEVSKIY